MPAVPPRRLSATEWLIVSMAALGFAFDIYELLVMPLIARPALAELLRVDPNTDSGNNLILAWTGYIMWGSALCGGTFGLLGGYLTDRFGRRRVLVWSILLYALSALAAGFSTSPEMLLVLRCTTFIGVCVEFVAAVAWLAELFPEPRRHRGHGRQLTRCSASRASTAWFASQPSGNFTRVPSCTGSVDG